MRLPPSFSLKLRALSGAMMSVFSLVPMTLKKVGE